MEIDVDQAHHCIKNVQKIETENGAKILLGKKPTMYILFRIMNKKYLLYAVEDFLENVGKFPQAMQFYHQYPIRTKSGDIFTEPGMINYTIELRDSDGNSHYKEVFFLSHIAF